MDVVQQLLFHKFGGSRTAITVTVGIVIGVIIVVVISIIVIVEDGYLLGDQG